VRDPDAEPLLRAPEQLRRLRRAAAGDPSQRAHRRAAAQPFLLGQQREVEGRAAAEPGRAVAVEHFEGGGGRSE
jgi:hypothetical protein